MLSALKQAHSHAQMIRGWRETFCGDRSLVRDHLARAPELGRVVPADERAIGLSHQRVVRIEQMHQHDVVGRRGEVRPLLTSSLL